MATKKIINRNSRGIEGTRVSVGKTSGKARKKTAKKSCKKVKTKCKVERKK